MVRVRRIQVEGFSSLRVGGTRINAFIYLVTMDQLKLMFAH